jgi:asparagine synthase (glutamine-hydrolysing)
MPVPAMEDVVARMVRRLDHRGPDGRGVHVVDQAADEGTPGAACVLGNTRLAILDLSPAGAQPMTDQATGNWVVYNGEIYNFRQVRAELGAGETWQSGSDTEVLLRAYRRWGRDCVHHFRGMFAFAIWDANRRELFLARDRLGI